MPPANTLVRWVDEIAFASVVQARPCPTFGRPVRHGVAPSTTARYCSANPSDPTSRWAPCPPQFRRGGSRSTLAVSSFRLRARLGISIPATCGRRGITPAFGYGPPHPGAGGTSTLLTSALPGAHLRTSPPPCRPDLTLAGCRLACAAPPAGLPVLRPIPSSTHATANTPAEPVGARVARFPTAGSLPRFNGGSASAVRVSRPARRSLALWPVWSLSRPRRPVASECFRRCCCLHHPLRLLPTGATVAGRDSHPLRTGAFSRRTLKYTLRRRSEASGAHEAVEGGPGTRR